MNIHKLKENLKRTIEGKELLLSGTNRKLVASIDRAEIIALDATAKFLHVNINELKLILADVEVCCEKAIEDSWRGVDRQGGI